MGANWPHFNLEHLFLFNNNNLTQLLAQTGFTNMTFADAHKVVDIDYICFQLNAKPRPIVTPFINTAVQLLPKSLLAHEVSLPLGQMRITASKP